MPICGDADDDDGASCRFVTRVVTSAQLIYRDVKPENVLLFPERGPLGGRSAKLTDFGAEP